MNFKRKGIGRAASIFLSMVMLVTCVTFAPAFIAGGGNALAAQAAPNVDISFGSQFVVPNGLTEAFARGVALISNGTSILDGAGKGVVYPNDKPVGEMFTATDGTPVSVVGQADVLNMQPEMLRFTDIEFGTEIWRVSNDKRSTHRDNAFGEAWNPDGSIMGLQTNRDHMNSPGSNADVTSIIFKADGSNLQKTANIQSGSTWATPAPFRWKDDELCYLIADSRLWTYNVKTGVYTNIETDRGMQYIDPSTVTGMTHRFVMNDDKVLIFIMKEAPNVDGKLLIIDLKTNPAQVWEWSSRLNFDFPPNHETRLEYGYHGIELSDEGFEVGFGSYDTAANANPAHFFFPFGPDGEITQDTYSVANAMVRGGIPQNNVDSEGNSRAIYDFEMPYLGHPRDITYTDTGSTIIAYFGKAGTNSQVGGGQGLHLIDTENGDWVSTVAAGVNDGHLAVSASNSEVLIASIRRSNEAANPQLLNKGNPYGEINNMVPFVNCYNPTSNYLHLARPSVSPDATKAFFHSGMLKYADYTGSINFVDGYVAVIDYPKAAVVSASDGNSATITWVNPNNYNTFPPVPTDVLETECFVIYRSDDNMQNFKQAGKVANDVFSFTDTAAAEDGAYYYVVARREWSGIESREFPTAVKLVKSGASYTAATLDLANTPARVKLTPPEAISAPAVDSHLEVTSRTTTRGTLYCAYNNIEWSAPADPANDISYYNIYYSVEGTPAAIPARRIASVPATEQTRYCDWQPRVDCDAEHQFYTVTAVDFQGNESTVAAAPAPGAPENVIVPDFVSNATGVILNPGIFNIYVGWNAPAGETAPTGYAIYVNGAYDGYLPALGGKNTGFSNINFLAADERSYKYSVTGLPPETECEIEIYSVYYGNKSSAKSLTATTGIDKSKKAYSAKVPNGVIDMTSGLPDAGYWGDFRNPDLELTIRVFGVRPPQCYFESVWDDDYLYVMGWAFDTDPLDAHGTNVYENDCFELYTNPTAKRAGAYEYGDYEIAVSAYNRQTTQGCKGFKSAAAIVDEAGNVLEIDPATLTLVDPEAKPYGFYCKFAIPWSSMLIGYNGDDESVVEVERVKARVGDVMGFDIDRNYRVGATRISQLMWNNDGESGFENWLCTNGLVLQPLQNNRIQGTKSDSGNGRGEAPVDGSKRCSMRIIPCAQL